MLLTLAGPILSDRLLLFSFTLYRHLKDLFYGHTYRNTDGVILVCPVSGAATRSFLTGNLKLSLEKARDL